MASLNAGSGISTHAMWQVYLDRITHGLFAGSFGAFNPHYFEGRFGFGFKYLTRSTPWLACANEAGLPSYIMHQTVLLTIGYYVTRWPIPDLLKFVIISGGSFLFIAVACEFRIRRVNVLRVAFGLKPQAKALARVQPALG